jgi:SAM-dependent methyltransferase
MKISNCNLCSGNLSGPILDLGYTPLANEFLSQVEEQDTFPLQVCKCTRCEQYQLNEEVSPERLFKHYLFVTGTSPVNVKHFRDYANHVVKKFNLSSDTLVLDVASNDGTFLQEFKNLGLKVLGVDPAENLATEATNKGLETIPDFFTETVAQSIVDKYGYIDVITANNVFAHMPNLNQFVRALDVVLSKDGIFIFEVSYLMDLCNSTAFDSIYHEHQFYWHIKPAIEFFKQYQMEIFDVERIPTQGGSIRVFVKRKGNSKIDTNINRVISILEAEYEMPVKMEILKTKIENLGKQLRQKISQLKSENKTIAIYGCPAKATTLLHYFQIEASDIAFAIDDNPLKQGRFFPGKAIPIFPSKAIYEKNPDVILILAWNFADNIIETHKSFPGKWIIPIPELKEVS